MGIGYQEKLGEEMTNRWWEQVYDKAASNLSSTGKSNEKDQDTIASSFAKLTDEELFKACGGRTAHKAARHGLRLSGKLERIECQEKKLIDDSSNLLGNENIKKEKRKKKRKKSTSEESKPENSNATEDVITVDVFNEVQTENNKICDSNSLCDEKVKKDKGKKKQRKSNNEEHSAKSCDIKPDIIIIEEDSNEIPIQKKRKHENIICDLTTLSDDDVKIVNSDLNNRKSKKLKKSKKTKK